tara:strand:+ start:42 stop:1742 length:1701 start_codon:yes stop_codon:yes gene_type:complete
MTTQRIIVTQNSSTSVSTDIITNDPNEFDRRTSPEARAKRIQALREKHKATVAEFDGENGTKYEVKSNGNQTTTTITEVDTQVDVYEGITSKGGGAFTDNTSSKKLTNNDITVAQEKLEKAVENNMLTYPYDFTGAEIPPNIDGNLVNAGDPRDLNSNIKYDANGIPIGRQDSSNSITEDGTTDADLKFGKVDNIIRKLHLRNLTYPLDADFGNSQDYMQINQFTYRPPNKGLFFRNDVSEDEQTTFDNILTKGVSTGAPRLAEDFLGLVKLPMPNSLADSNNVSWGADQLNALTAAVSSAVFGATDNLADAFFGEKGVFDSEDFKKAGNFGKARQIIGGFGNAVTDDQFIKKVREVFQSATTQGTNLNVLGRTLAGSALLNAAQFGISPETVLARGQGVVPNNNLALLFNSPTLREFTFSWKMTPRSREEATRVNNIIRFFKQGMAPKKAIGTKTGGASYFLGTPNVFDIIFKTTKDGGNFFFDGDDENNSVLRIKTCACTGSAVNYTPDGMWNAYDRGQPVSITLSLRFAELEPIFDIDYDENVFNYDEGRPDLRPVPIDAVGY